MIYKTEAFKMGVKEDEFELGNDCGTCEPDLWLDGLTPAFVNIVFQGIEKVGTQFDPPNGLKFRLDQLVLPCVYMGTRDYEGHEWTAEWDARNYAPPPDHLSLIYLYCNDVGGGWAFIWSTATDCLPVNGDTVDNWLDGTPPQWYKNGTARIWWERDAIPRTCALTYGLNPVAGNLHDRWLLDDDEQIIRIANPADKTNILIRVDETAF